MITTQIKSQLQHNSSFFNKAVDKFTSDPRHYQITFLLIFLLFGITNLGWEVEKFKFIVTFITCLSTQAVFTFFTNKDFNSLKSALISSLSLCLMFKTNEMGTIFLAGFLSVASKFMFRFNGKHIFNPTNFGIIITILLSGKAWISPGQWGSNGLLLLFIGLLGLTVLLRVKRLDTAFAFFITFVGLSFMRNVLYQGWPIDFFFHQFTSGTLLLFTFFMITDPVSTPSHKIARIMWSVLIGVLAFYMQHILFVNGAPIWALFMLSPLTILLDKLFSANQFKWK